MAVRGDALPDKHPSTTGPPLVSKGGPSFSQPVLGDGLEYPGIERMRAKSTPVVDRYVETRERVQRIVQVPELERLQGEVVFRVVVVAPPRGGLLLGPSMKRGHEVSRTASNVEGSPSV